MNLPAATIDLGGLTVSVLDGGSFRLDGAALFGIFPRVFWEKMNRPDEDNRVLLGLAPVVVTTPAGSAVIDPGIGYGWGAHAVDRYALRGQRPLAAMLADAGVEPDDVRAIIATHLHFDHVSGAVTGALIEGGDFSDPRVLSEGMLDDLEPALPRARLIVQREEHLDAARPELRTAPYMAGAVSRVYEQAGRLELISGPVEPLPGVKLEPTGGHTAGHQVVWLQGHDGSMLLSADLVPTTAHLRSEVLEGVDAEPIVSARAKASLLARAVERGAYLTFYHAPRIRWGRIRSGPAGSYQLEETETVPSRGMRTAPSDGDAHTG